MHLSHQTDLREPEALCCLETGFAILAPFAGLEGPLEESEALRCFGRLSSIDFCSWLELEWRVRSVKSI